MTRNGDRVAAAQIRLDQAERLMEEARKILNYADKNRQDDTETGWTRSTTEEPAQGSVGFSEPVNGIYAGQIPDEVYIDEEDSEECDT